MFCFVSALGEAQQDAGLPHTAVPDDDELEEEVVVIGHEYRFMK